MSESENRFNPEEHDQRTDVTEQYLGMDQSGFLEYVSQRSEEDLLIRINVLYINPEIIKKFLLGSKNVTGHRKVIVTGAKEDLEMAQQMYKFPEGIEWVEE